MPLALLVPAALAASFSPAGADVLVGVSGYPAWGDYDDDGDPDLWDGASLWRNDGGRFVRVSPGPGGGLGLFGDVDNDGDLDLYTFSSDAVVYLNEGDAGWIQAPGSFDTGIVQSLGAAWADLNGDGLLDVYIGGYEGNGYEVDAIYLGLGDGQFTRWWSEPPSGPYTAYTKPGRGVTVCDFDEDSDLDVYVSNYRLEPNSLWRNDGAAGFEEAAWYLGLDGDDDGWDYSFGHTIGSAWGDLDEDGDFDLFVGNFSHPYYYQDRPKFLENLGPDAGWAFRDRSRQVLLTWQESFASPALGDYDNDGDLDLYFTTVYGGDYPVLLRNDGDWTFTDVTAREGLAFLPATYQAAWADYDRDGDLDLVTAGGLWINAGHGRHWLTVQLAGDGQRTDTLAVGAQVRIQLGDRTLTRQVEAGTGQGNQNDGTLHFGLEDAADPIDLAIRWPDGTRQRVAGVAVDQHVRIAQCRDADGDGAWPADCEPPGGSVALDCDDADPSAYPGAPEVWYDDIDQDCSSAGAPADDDWDADGDGWRWGEGDCDDFDAVVFPGAVEVWYDGVDADCALDSDYDADGDGYDAAEFSGGDCDDADAGVFPGAVEVWYDGVDADCGADSDWDADGDGYDDGVDCDDDDPQIHPGAPEIAGDEADGDCDGEDRSAGCAVVGGGGWWWGVVVLWRRRS